MLAKLIIYFNFPRFSIDYHDVVVAVPAFYSQHELIVPHVDLVTTRVPAEHPSTAVLMPVITFGRRDIIDIRIHENVNLMSQRHYNMILHTKCGHSAAPSTR